jgi:hypothetical protein
MLAAFNGSETREKVFEPPSQELVESTTCDWRSDLVFETLFTRAKLNGVRQP